MALLIHLSLLFVAVQLPFVLVSEEYTVEHDNACSADEECSWKIKSEPNNHFTLEVKAQKLGQCLPMNGANACFDISYNPNKCISLCLKQENALLSLSCEIKDTSEENSCSAGHKIVPISNITLGLLLTNSLNNKLGKIKFKCLQQNVSSCTSNVAYLQLFQNAKSWIDALEHCQRENSSLAEITDQTESNKLKLQSDDLRNGTWIGLQRSIFGKNPEWKWISGAKVAGSQWNVKFPVNPNNHCGKIILVDKEIKLQDANCHERLPYICQSLNERPCPNNVILNADISDEN